MNPGWCLHRAGLHNVNTALNENEGGRSYCRYVGQNRWQKQRNVIRFFGQLSVHSYVKLMGIPGVSSLFIDYVIFS